MVTTFLTIRQSQKRGMMPAATPDNPMASSQKYMTYIMPFFALTGLYWPFGLVLYWVTTNVWTLGQQFILGRRFPYTPPAADTATASGTSSAPAGARALQSGSSAKGSTARGTTARGTTARGTTPRASAPRAGSGGSGSSSGSTARAGAGGSRPSGGRTQSAKRAGANGASAVGSRGGGSGGGATANGASANGAPGSGMLKRLANRRAEPEPEPELPDVKLVRHQTQRQSRSKRSGKR
jgi:YidC/Oxa1 family membrane protein insertase